MIGIIVGLVLLVLTIPIKTAQLAMKLRAHKHRKDSKASKKEELRMRLNKAGGSSKEHKGEKKKQKKLKKETEKSKKKHQYLQMAAGALQGLVASLRSTAVSMIVAGIASSLVLICIIATLAASAGFIAVLYGNISGSGGGGYVMGGGSATSGEGYTEGGNLQAAAGNTKECLEAIAHWYVNHVATYWDVLDKGTTATAAAHSYYDYVTTQDTSKSHMSGDRRMYYCELVDGFVGDDCTAFATAYAMLVSGQKVTAVGSGTMISSWDATNVGFVQLKVGTDITSVDQLQPGDICVKSGHAELIWDAQNNQTFGWGQVRASYPNQRTVLFDGGQLKIGGAGPYVVVYRYVGNGG